MRIAPLYLALALILLWLPTALCLGRRRRRELRDRTHGELVTLPSLLRSPWAWIDLVRAAVGAFVLTRFVLVPTTSGPVSQLHVVAGLAVFCVPPVIGSWVQTMITGSRSLRLAPLFYLLGIAAVVLPWTVSLFGSVLGLTLTGMLRRWRFVFWVVPTCLAAASVLFRQIGVPTVLVLFIFAIPALLGLNPNRPLAWIFSPSHGWKIHGSGRSRRHRKRSTKLPRSTALAPAPVLAAPTEPRRG